MSDKSIELNQGGNFDFKVTKLLVSDVERFSVTIGSGYRDGLDIANNLTWAEASQAMNKFRDEFDDAFEALVQVSTLTPLGVHEDA